MNYEDIVADFVSRTRQNLLATDGLSRTGQPTFYEVTHLVNSLLGLVVVPKERMLDRLPETSVTQLRRSGWPIPASALSGPQDLRALVRELRNAVCHFDLEPLPDELGAIQGVTLRNARGPGTSFQMTFTVAELRSFVERLADEVSIAVAGPASQRTPPPTRRTSEGT